MSGLSKLRELDLSGRCAGALPAGVKGLAALARLRVGPGEALQPQQFGREDAAWLQQEFGQGVPFARDVSLFRVWQ